jgi:anti-sigma-K factor RskA
MSTLDRRPDDIEELLGAYALDAVDDDERRIVDAYVAINPRAQAEVDQHREVATLLAFGGADAPDGLWDRIALALDERGEKAPEPGPELARVLPARRRGRRRWWLGGLAAAAALVLVAALSIALVNRDGGGSSQAGSIVAAFDAAKSDPANTTVQLASPDGTTRATAVVEPSGRAFLDPTSLPALAGDRTYQLWAVLDDGTPVSLGVLGASPQLTMFGLNGPVKALAITDETAGGVVAPTKAPQIVGTVS